MPEGVERLAIVDEKVEACRARRELGGMPSAYWEVGQCNVTVEDLEASSGWDLPCL